MNYLKFILCGIILGLLGGCNTEQAGNNPENVDSVIDPATETATASAEGIWLKASDGITDGMELDVSGRLHYLNMYTLTGSSWFRMHDTLFVSGFTERYPDPDTMRYLMRFNGSDTLLISAIDGRHDGAAGTPEQYVRWNGNETLRKFAGRWTGVEGTWLEVFPLTDSTCRLTFRDLDNALFQTDGLLQNGILSFKRNGISEILTTGTGTETGMKWLDGKNNCLVIATKSEGYCKD